MDFPEECAEAKSPSAASGMHQQVLPRRANCIALQEWHSESDIKEWPTCRSRLPELPSTELMRMLTAIDIGSTRRGHEIQRWSKALAGVS